MNDLARKVHDDPNRSAHYMATIRAYSAVLDQLGSARIARLQKMNIDQRLAELTEWVNKEMALNHNLSTADRAAISNWLADIRYKEENFERLGLSYDPDSLIIWELLNPDATTEFVTKEDVDELLDRLLSPDAAELLYALGSDSDIRKHLGLWVSAAVQPAGANGGANGTAKPDAVDWNRKFSDLPKDVQDALELMPEEEARKFLGRSPAPTAPLNPLPPAANGSSS